MMEHTSYYFVYKKILSEEKAGKITLIIVEVKISCQISFIYHEWKKKEGKGARGKKELEHEKSAPSKFSSHVYFKYAYLARPSFRYIL